MSAWSSRLVEIHRFGEDDSSIRRKDDYLIACDREPVTTFCMPLRQDDVDAYREDLRAELQGSSSLRPPLERAEARDRVIDAVSEMLGVTHAQRGVHVDLVVSASEITQLPFEAAEANGAPLFGSSGMLLTRRIRGAFAERESPWPAKARVLFIAAGPHEEVPAEDHCRALRSGLSPWMAPDGLALSIEDEEAYLVLRESACLPEIEAAMRASIECRPPRPFTHIHVLAHGAEIASRKWGLRLFGDSGTGSRVVSAEEFATALQAGGYLPRVVTVTACDSANGGSPSHQGASIARALHAAGVPVVAGSQLPMTTVGSTVFVEAFYREVLTGTDVRDALRLARDALCRNVDAAHDWMSLAVYLRLPEGYTDQLLEVQLGGDLVALEAADASAKRAVADDAPLERYAAITAAIERQIAALQDRVAKCVAARRTDLLPESRGLLASANKRLAELLFVSAMSDTDPAASLERSRNAFGEAATWYAAAFEDRLSSHWTAVQSLSLEVVSTGRIKQPWRWHAAMHAATVADDVIWARGSRMELWLLARYADEPDAVERAALELRTLIEDVHGDLSCQEVISTHRQLLRYVNWWTRTNGFFGEAGDLARDVRSLLKAVGLPVPE